MYGERKKKKNGASCHRPHHKSFAMYPSAVCTGHLTPSGSDAARAPNVRRKQVPPEVEISGITLNDLWRVTAPRELLCAKRWSCLFLIRFWSCPQRWARGDKYSKNLLQLYRIQGHYSVFIFQWKPSGEFKNSVAKRANTRHQTNSQQAGPGRFVKLAH